MISAYLVDIIILLLAAVIIVPLFEAARFGAVPGFLIAGVIVGPSGLGIIRNVSEIGHLAEIGVVLLLFVIGIELKPSRLWLMRHLVFGMGTLQVIITGFLLGGASYLYFDIPVRVAILVGPALALSSTAFVLQILSQQKLLRSPYGRASVSVLLLQDLAVVPLLLLVPLLSMPEMSIGEDIGLALVESMLIIGLVVVIGRYFLHPVLYRVALSGNPEIFTASAVLIVIGTALATEHAGMSMAMGAFLAGLLISDSYYRHQVLAEIQPFRGLLLGLFFMSMGMSLDLEQLLDNPSLSLSLVALLIVIKALALLAIAMLFRLTVKVSFAVGVMLAQSGEFAMVLFSMSYQSGLLAEGLFQQLLLVVLLSMVATPLLAKLASCFLGDRCMVVAKSDTGEPASATVVLAGFGRVGHRIGEMLSRAGISFVAFDTDASVVERECAKGHQVYYGDVRKPELLKNVGIGDARAIIVTLDDPDAADEVVASLRKTYPDKKIYARGHSLAECQHLHQLGVTGVVSENIEASLELAYMAMNGIGYSKSRGDEILEDFRRAYRGQIGVATRAANSMDASKTKDADAP